MLRTIILAVALMIPASALAAPLTPSCPSRAGVHGVPVQMKVIQAPRARMILFNKYMRRGSDDVQKGDILI